MQKILKLLGKDIEKSKKVSYFCLQGQISSAMTYKVYKALKKFKPDNSKAIALIINSKGGSLAHSYIIYQKFDLLRKKYNLPLYTFAEDYALSGAFYLLSMGDKIFCHKTSLVGGLGTQINTINIKQLLQYYNIEVNNFQTKNSFLSQIDPFGNNSDVNELEIINKQQSQELLNQYLLLNKNNSVELQNGQIFNGQQLYEQIKYTNGIGNYINILQNEFPQNKLENATQKTQREKMNDFFQKILQ